MLSLLLQVLSAVLLLAMAAVALAVARRGGPGDPFHREAWRLTGITFLVEGSAVLASNAFGAVAMAAGPGSVPMQRFVALLPVFNNSRTFMVTGGVVALAWLALRKRLPGRGYWLGFAALLTAGTLVGAAIGFREGGFQRTTHVPALAVWDVTELLVLLSTLFLLLVTNRVDRLLWALYGAYACSLALGIFWFLILGQIAPGWTPPLWTRLAVRNLLYLLMAAIAFLRWRVSLRGTAVHGMLGPPRLQVSMIR